MKKFLPVIIASIFIFSSCSYDPGVSEAFMKYRLKDGVTTITVPGWVIGLASQFADLEKEERELLQSIHKVRVLAIEDHELNERVNLHQEFYNLISKKGDYDELLVVHNTGEDVTIFGRMDGDVIEEMVILVGGDDNALVFIKGEIDPELLNKSLDLTRNDRFLSLK